MLPANVAWIARIAETETGDFWQSGLTPQLGRPVDEGRTKGTRSSLRTRIAEGM